MARNVKATKSKKSLAKSGAINLEVKLTPPYVNQLGGMLAGDPGPSALPPADLLRRAWDGDTACGNEILLRCYLALVRYPNPTWERRFPREFAYYIAYAFGRILDGVDASKALGIKKRVGRPAERSTEKRSEALAAAVALLVRKGYRERTVIDWFIEDAGRSQRTIENSLRREAWARNPDLNEDYLALIAKPFAQVIRRFISAKRRR